MSSPSTNDGAIRAMLSQMVETSEILAATAGLNELLLRLAHRTREPAGARGAASRDH